MTKSNAYKTSWTPERKKAFSEFRTGQKHAAATIEKMRKSALGPNKHYQHTPETRLLMSTQRKGVPLCVSHHGKMNTGTECNAPYGETEHRKYFTELIETKYAGKPFYTKEEMKLLRGNYH